MSPDPCPGQVPANLIAAIRALLAAIDTDENHSGGLISRETLRRAGELRIALEAALSLGGEPP